MNRKARNPWTVNLAAVFVLLAILLWFVPGIRFSSYVCAGLSVLCVAWCLLSKWAERSKIGKRCRRCFLWIMSGLLIGFLAIEAVLLLQGEENPSGYAADAVIVLGAGVNGETPSLTLQTRINAAAEYLTEHPGVPAVLSGGQGDGERISEAEAMRRGLIACGISEERLFLEDNSTSTAENVRFSREILVEHGFDLDGETVAVVTNDFHIVRAKWLAQQEGFDAIGIPAELPWWWLTANYYIREAFALVKTLVLD